jgi:transcriptional regulator with XRE-family HTH domain
MTHARRLRIDLISHLALVVAKLRAVSRIRQIREEKAKLAPAVFTQAAVAARVGVTINALRAWELDRARPRKAAAKRLARALGVQVEELSLAEPAVASLQRGAETSGDLAKVEDSLIRLEAELTDLGGLLGRRWDDEDQTSPRADDVRDRVMRRIGRIEARIAEVGVPAPTGGYPPRPESGDEELLGRWAAEELPILRHQVLLVQERAHRFGTSLSDTARQAQ